MCLFRRVCQFSDPFPMFALFYVSLQGILSCSLVRALLAMKWPIFGVVAFYVSLQLILSYSLVGTLLAMKWPIFGVVASHMILQVYLSLAFIRARLALKSSASFFSLLIPVH